MRNDRLGLRLFLLLGCAAALALPAHAGNWPRFRGPNGTGVSDDKNVPVEWNASQGVLWKVPLPGAGNSCPVVWGDRLFVQSATTDGKERLLLCLDAATGKERWTKSVPGAPAPKHKKNTLATSTPTTDGKRVYALFWDGQDIALHAYDLDGQPLWQTPLGPFKSQHGPGTSPVVYQDRVFLANDQDGTAGVVALDADTGKLAWHAMRQAYRTCYSTPFLLDNPKYGAELVVASTTGITAYDPKSGNENWQAHWKWTSPSNPLRTVASPIVNEGLIFISGGEGPSGPREAVAVKVGSKGTDAADSLAWDHKRDVPYMSTMLARGEHLYYVTDDGFAGCRLARTGEKVWHQRLGSNMTASPVLVDGKVYACDDDGDVYVFAAEPAFKLLAHNAVGEPVSATPAVADGRLFIRGDKHLFCIGKPAGK
jgi:outer membrane protein assembly factor BamB